jgi:hypothetical protein
LRKGNGKRRIRHPRYSRRAARFKERIVGEHDGALKVRIPAPPVAVFDLSAMIVLILISFLQTIVLRSLVYQ